MWAITSRQTSLIMRIGLDAVAQKGYGKSSNSQDKVKIERTSVPGRVSGSTDFVVLLKRGLKEERSSRQ